MTKGGKKFKIKTIYINSLISKDPIGYELIKGDKTEFMYRSQLIAFMQSGGEVEGVQLFERKNPGGITIVTIKSTEKGKPLNRKELCKNINYLQRRSWNNEIDYTNIVQLKFTVRLEEVQ